LRILALSDTHGLLPRLPLEGVDCVMHAGDICPTHDHSLRFQLGFLEGPFSDWVRAAGLPFYAAMGNHDFVGRFAGPPNLRHGTAEVRDGVFIFSWTPVYLDWAWNAHEPELAERIERALAAAPEPPAVWLFHGPPLGVCDGPGLGSAAIREAAERHRPELLICGHIHEGAGAGAIGRTKVRNVSCLDESYRPARAPALLETGTWRPPWAGR
jgi:predicted phosphodiesterase